MVTPEQDTLLTAHTPRGDRAALGAVWALPGKKRRNMLRRRSGCEIIPRFSFYLFRDPGTVEGTEAEGAVCRWTGLWD